ncbi:MAG TPA: tlde1 domain-containing protein [Sphingobium sp.]
MWTYRQSTGELFRDGRYQARGYSGHEWGRNNPRAQTAPGIGPIPAGRWRMAGIEDSVRVGPRTIILHCIDATPGDDRHDATGRGAFRIHGDSIREPGEASHGCIILPRAMRIAMWQSGDHELEVVP